MSSAHPLIDIVDDDDSVCLTLSNGLKRIGFRTRCFSNGKEFLEGLTDHIPDCTLLDLRMPGISGIDILELVPRELRDFPIIFLTSHADVAIAVKAMKEGAFDFLEKPCKLEFLAEKIALAIEKSQSGRGRDAARDLNSAIIARLPPVDQEVARRLKRGASPSEIGDLCDLTPSEVETCIRNVQSALGVNSFADLVRNLPSL